MPSPSPSPLTEAILSRATHDSISLTALPFLPSALSSISSLSLPTPTPNLTFTHATKTDTHTHAIPPWFRALAPLAAGRATPDWDPAAHLAFMAARGIAHSVLSISTPAANAFSHLGDAAERKERTIALARLLNEYGARVCALWPGRFSWMAVVPLPYVEAAVVEARYALGELGAVGVGVLTNHEGWYVGDVRFDALWGEVERWAGEQEDGRGVVFVHPTEPVVRLGDGRIVMSRPSPLRSGLGEFYFETARAVSSLIATSTEDSTPTFLKFPSLHWRISHGAGAFPDISERFLLGFPDVADEAREALKTRFWYDSAGPVFPNQVKGLTEGMGVPISQFVFGTDYPYGIGFWDVDANIAGLASAEFLTAEEKEMVFWKNAETLWKGKITHL